MKMNGATKTRGHRRQQNKKVKDFKPKRKISIGLKINALTISITLIMILLMCVLGFQSLRFSNEYSGVLENISKITYIKTNATKTATTLINLCNFGGSIQDSGYIETVELMNQYVDDIEKNISDDAKYNQNRYQLAPVRDSVHKYTEMFNEIRDACGEEYSPEGTPIAEKMVNEASFTSLNAEILLTYEITRSEDVQKEIQENFAKTIKAMVIMLLVVGVFAIFCAIKVSIGITSPLKQLQKKIAIMAKGDLSEEDIVIRANDESRELAEAFNQMKHNLTTIIGKVSTGTDEMKKATETVETSMSENAKGNMHISEAVDGMFTSLETQTLNASDIKKHVTKMGTIAEDVSNSAQRISQKSNDSMEKAALGSENVQAFIKQMDTVNDTMTNMSNVFVDFSNSTNEMSKILATISEISEQTNLLSLNASIEAARAGDAGLGFSVVATEIRKLADDSNNAANEISVMISTLQKDVESMNIQMQESLEELKKGNKIAEETGNSFTLIKNGTEIVNEDVSAILEKVENLSDVMKTSITEIQEIQNASENNVTEINRISEIVNEETANQEEVSATTTVLVNLAKELEEEVSGFKLKDIDED